MKKILLFTGAGMNVPMGLPTAIGFEKTIKKCESSLLVLLTEHLGGNSKDIEKILYVLEDFINGSAFFKHILNSYQHSTTAQMNSVMNNILINAKTFQQNVKHDIFKILQDFDSKKALSIYLNILEAFKDAEGKFSLSIFTTNYDLIFEDMILENSEEFEKFGYTDFNFGFKDKWGKVRFDKIQDFEWSDSIIEYNKLHGSLDWTKDNKGIVVKTGAVTLPAEPDNMPLLYPGYKGTPTDEPFLTMHNKLYLRLIECDEVYVVGFAFRDPYINSIFEFALKAKHNLRINCYNPIELKDLPYESGLPNFVKNYRDQFIYYKKGISEETNPLDIPPF